MQNIKIICVGKIKEKYMYEAVDEYLKRLSRYAKIQIIELKDQKIPDNAGTMIENAIKDKEGSEILSKISQGDFVITMCIEGKQISSVEFARKIANLGVDGNSNIAFIIGGSLGLSDMVKDVANFSMSMSVMTFTHQMARVLLLEQIYRAYKINSNETYHK